MAFKLGIFGLEEHFPYIESGIKQAGELFATLTDAKGLRFDIVGIVDNYEWNRKRRDALAVEFSAPSSRATAWSRLKVPIAG